MFLKNVSLHTKPILVIVICLSAYENVESITAFYRYRQAPAYNLIPSVPLNDDERFEALLDAYVSLNLVLPPVYASPKKEPKTAHPSIRNPDRIPFAWRPPKTPNGLWDYSKDFEGIIQRIT